MKNLSQTYLKLIKKHKSFGGWVEFYSHFSNSTQTPMSFSIFRPSSCFEKNEKKIPALIWLSGLTCNEENFITKSHVQREAERLGLMIIAPDTSPRGTNLPHEHTSYDFGSGAGFYLNATTEFYRDHYRMYDYIVEEIPSLLQKFFSLDPKRLGLFGHSMGGHGALMIGLKNPKLIKSISAFSPICAPTLNPWGQKAFEGYLGQDKEKWKQYDTCEILLQLYKDGLLIPKDILIDQGTEDEFLKEQLSTNRLCEVAQAINYPLRLRYQEGYDHSYYFISTFINEHLKFHADSFERI